MFELARIHGMTQINGVVWYDSNDKDEESEVDEDDDSTFHDTIQVESAIYDTINDDDEPIHGETINNDFNLPTGFEEGATGVTMEEENILYAQYCHVSGDLYYQSIEIYGDDPAATDEAIEMMANATQSWSLCDGAPPLPTHPILSLESDMQYQSEMEFDRQVIERNNRLAYQGLLDNCEDVGITEAEVQAAQAPLKQATRKPDRTDWERMRKYLGNVPAEMVRNTFKHTTQIGTLPPSSHLQRQFKSPNPALNIHRRNEADATDQIFSKVAAMDGGEMSAHIFVGQDSKITNVYKAKDESFEALRKCIPFDLAI